ncbi:MAG: NYN domain-containing protein [Prosthecobacter sp.]|nr:NYN domain-containing protein [Prosthecobacter sp.]
MSSAVSAENIALLIDADNAPAAKIGFIIAELASHGVVNIRRAYGNWKKSELARWEEVLHEYAIQPMQHFDLVKGKNASDMALLIEAMDILYTKHVGTFGLVSSDCDFTPLVLRLRAEGRQVIGFGDRRAPAPFVGSCTRFLYLDEPDTAKNATSASAPLDANSLKGDTRLMNMLRSAVEASAGEDGWAALGGVGNHISNQGSFDRRNYGFAKLSDLFNAIDCFEVRRVSNGSGTLCSVRKRPKKVAA